MRKFTSVTSPEKMETILKYMKVTEVSMDGSNIKRIDFTGYAGPGYMVASEYGSSMKMFLEVKPKYWLIELEEEECPDELKQFAKYVVEKKIQFSSKEEAQKEISGIGMSAKNFLIAKEIDPNEEEPKARPSASTDELPF
jgi:hypothetical protein